MMAAGGLDAAKAWLVLTEGAPGSPLVKGVTARAAANDGSVNFALKLMAKDLRYAINAASKEGLALKTAASALEIFQSAIAQGRGDEDLSAVVNAGRPARKMSTA